MRTKPADNNLMLFARLIDRHKSNTYGFSLSELLVTVAIIAVAIISILAAVAIPIFLNQRDKAQDSTIQQQVKTMADQLAAMVQTPTNTWTGLGTASGNLTIDGISTPKSGVLPYANTTTRNWCASKQSPTTGQIFAASNTSTTSGVYAATQPCTSAASAPTSGTLSATIVSETGNLLTDNQATLEGGTATGAWNTALNTTPTASQDTANEGTYSLKHTTSGVRAYDHTYSQTAPSPSPVTPPTRLPSTLTLPPPRVPPPSESCGSTGPPTWEKTTRRGLPRTRPHGQQYDSPQSHQQTPP